MAPDVDALEEDFSEFGVKFVTSLTDAGSPYTTEQWQTNFGSSDAPLVVDENASSTGMFSLFHDSWNAFPTFALIDHTMTVRAKPWTLDSNSNTNPCDGSNTTIDGWSGGNTTDFIQQLVDECGALCEPCSGTIDSDGDGIADECDDCNNMSGDTNDDMVIDILDIVTVVNIILNGGMNSSQFTECEKLDADFDSNGTINILDIIQIINIILSRNYNQVDIEGSSELKLEVDNDDIVITVASDVDLSGIQISFFSDELLDITINDSSSDMTTYTKLYNGIQRFVGFSMENVPFQDDFKILINNGSHLTSDDLDIILASTTGQEVEEIWTHSELNAFMLNNMYPNPFNPSTEIDYTVSHDGNMTITVYNVLGQIVSELYDGYLNAGNHSILWKAENLASGVYYVNMVHANGQVENIKAVLLK